MKKFDLISAIDNNTASEVLAAAFRESNTYTTFYRLAGKVFRYVYNIRDTTSDFFMVTGEDLEIFNAYYA